MDDDESSRSERTTRRTSSVDPESGDGEGIDESTRQYDVDQDTLQKLREKTGLGDGSSEADETAELEREKLLETVSRDRQKRRDEPETIPVDAVDPDDDSETTDDNVAREMARELERLDDAGSEATLETSIEVSQLEGTSDGDEEPSEQIEFPARIEENLKISVPADKAARLGLSPGDLVVVDIKKIGN